MARRFKRQDKQKKRALRASNACAHIKSIHKASVKTAKKYVLNLSSYSLKDNEYILLAKGLKFIPSPQKSNVKWFLLKDFDEFARKLNSFLITEKIVKFIPSEHRLVTNPIRPVAHLKITLIKLN